MIIIGEKLNSSIPRTMEALNNKDEGYLLELIKKQEQAQAQFLDINTAMCGDKEEENLLWLIGLTLKHSQCGIMLDSPSPQLIKNILPTIKDRPVIVNSVTISQRFNELIPFIFEHGAAVVGLPIDENGVAETLEGRKKNIDKLMEKFREAGFPEDKIYLDIIVEALAANTQSGCLALESIGYIQQKYPGVKSTCGLSNISFGLPKRININTAFLSAAIFMGLSSAIIDNTNPAISQAIAASLTVAGQDKNCLKYIKFMRRQIQAEKEQN